VSATVVHIANRKIYRRSQHFSDRLLDELSQIIEFLWLPGYTCRWNLQLPEYPGRKQRVCNFKEYRKRDRLFQSWKI